MAKFSTIFTKNDRISVRDASNLVRSGEPVSMVMPLWIGLRDDPEWKLPVEPLISIQGRNVIVKRNVAKSLYRGTIKERWAEDDFSISIQGSFVHQDMDTYPEADVQRLMYYVNQKQSLYVKNELLAMLGINQIVIESYALPFSKGENVQNYSINAFSDDTYNLFIELK